MPALRPIDAPFRTHHWPARQSASQASTYNIIMFVIPLLIVLFFVILLVVCISRCLRRSSRAYVAPNSVVRIVPGSRFVPVPAEILANNHPLVVPRGEATRDIPATVSSSAPLHAQDTLRAMNGPTEASGLLLGDENDRGSRTSLDAGARQADVDGPPRTVILHEDDGHAPHVDETELVGLLPPILDANVVPANEPPRTVITHQDVDDDRVSQVDAAGPIDVPPPYSSLPLP